VNDFDFASRWAWLIFIAFSAINFVFMDRFGLTEEDRQLDLPRRRRYLAWLWGLFCVPWLVLGFGQLTGNISNIWSIFRPQDGNPYVWAVFAAILLVYVVVVYWVLFRDGARIAEELRLLKFHAPGKSGAVSAFWIKVIALGMLPFFAFWIWMVVQMDVPMPLVR
jgi:hypothetical protein